MTICMYICENSVNKDGLYNIIYLVNKEIKLFFYNFKCRSLLPLNLKIGRFYFSNFSKFQKLRSGDKTTKMKNKHIIFLGTIGSSTSTRKWSPLTIQPFSFGLKLIQFFLCFRWSVLVMQTINAALVEKKLATDRFCLHEKIQDWEFALWFFLRIAHLL